MAGDGVAVVAGIAHQGPPRPEGLAHLVGEAQRPAHRRRALGAVQPGGQRGGRLQEHLVEGQGDRWGTPADRLGMARGSAHPDARLAVIGGEHPGEGPVADEELDARPGRPGVVGEVGGPAEGPGTRTRAPAAPTERAIRERSPSAPTTNPASSSTVSPARSRADTPITRPSASRRTPVTVVPKRRSAPADPAASATSASSTYRRGATR